jgi:hypothetical protein
MNSNKQHGMGREPNDHQPNERPRDDAWFKQQLGALDRDVPAIDDRAVARVLTLAGKVFSESDPYDAAVDSSIATFAKSSEASTAKSSSAELADQVRVEQRIVTGNETRRGRKTMLTRALVAVTATACAIVLVIDPMGSTSGRLTLGSILEKTVQSKSLQMRVTRHGDDVDVWVNADGRIRWEESATRYAIAAGGRLWRVDEEQNTVENAKNPWVDEEGGQIDLLSMLDVGGDAAAQFRAKRADEIVEHAGRSCYVFRLSTEHHGRPLFLEAFVDQHTRQVQTIAAWPNRDHQGIPLAELTLVARNLAVDESKFAVSKSLSADGRIGKVSDLQGLCTLRPLSSRRWTPIARQMLIKPGDWLRTDVRGANASTVLLTSQFRVIVGPGSLIEWQGPRRIRLHGGEVNIHGAKSADGEFELLGPHDQKVTLVAGKTSHYVLDREGVLKQRSRKPTWLAGYESSSNAESIGSLIAKIDHRDVPLSVGFHRVKVEIRDQIARTTIEQSFVNRTGTTLEGIFYFPLPQDASISGFGMWIGGELVEADVVEKQRAREIYETILREKRDPGLLEWTGGNIFKARVFPINPYSEKRIKIVYTQVLPLRANRYRYSYGLRSELLQTTPVRELSVEVHIHSTLPLKSVDCPTHATRNLITKHSAKLDFSAQEYSPDRDFEVVCEVDSRQSDVVIIPHRRGDDGYFLVQLTPPGAVGNWQREILPDGKPLELLLVCDTSASMDSTKRRQQAEFVASVLTSLGPTDRFNIAVCDVDCQWLFEKPTKATDTSVPHSRDWLAARVSLGWTDLDQMTKSVLQHTTDNTHVIYIGDAVVTAGDADPIMFVNRLKRLTNSKRHGTFHAVAVGNSFESTVLRAIARVGGGSFRKISGGQSPARVAFELLNEISQPGMRDLKIEFRGIEIAAVYPDRLPNLPAGTQQILIGRYRLQGADQTGEILVRGTRDGETVQYATRITLTDAESGNSFIPRLWARAHLDYLLAQGGSQHIRDDIISLSEKFHIITPYTSLLVLESDADRERFGVQRRFQMRDGQKFFAEGRDKANYELLRAAMKRSGDWRLGLRRQILIHLARQGRDSAQLQAVNYMWRKHESIDSRNASQSELSTIPRYWYEGSADFNSGIRGPIVGGMGGSGFRTDGLSSLTSDFDNGLNWSGDDEDFFADSPFSGESILDTDFEGRHKAMAKTTIISSVSRSVRRTLSSISSKLPADRYLVVSREYDRIQPHARYTAWVQTFFPSLPAKTIPAQVQKMTWAKLALEISNSLVQEIQLADGGLEIRRETSRRDPVWDRATGINHDVQLFANKRWLHFTKTVGQPTVVQWCDAEHRGAYRRAFGFGRTRETKPDDLLSFAPGLRPYADKPLHEVFRRYDVTFEQMPEDRAALLLTNQQQPLLQVRITIDTKRNVVEKLQQIRDGKVTSTTTHADYTLVAGTWWPQSTVTLDLEGNVTSTIKQTVKQLRAEEFETRYVAELPPADEAILIAHPLPLVGRAEAAAAAGAADLEDRFVLLLRSIRNQRWEEVRRELNSISGLAPERPGIRWLRTAVLLAARENDQASQLLSEIVSGLSQVGSDDEYFVIGYVVRQASQIVDNNERLRLLDLAQAIYMRQPAHVLALRDWQNQRAQTLRSLGRATEAIALQTELARRGPWDVSAQTTLANDLAEGGDYQAAFTWLRREMDRVQRPQMQVDQLRNQYSDLLKRRGDADKYVALMEEWIQKQPTTRRAYDEYLSSLTLNEQMDEADALVLKWLESAGQPAELKGAERARFESAVAYALGQRHDISVSWMDPIWLKPLEDAARSCLTHEHHLHFGIQIINGYRFNNKENADRLRNEAADRLLKLAITLPEGQVSQLVGVAIGKSTPSAENWLQIAATLRARWEQVQTYPKRNALGNAILQIYARHARKTEQLSFMRLRIARAEEEGSESWEITAYRKTLYNQLIASAWDQDNEVEALDLLEKLSAAATAGERLVAAVGALQQFVDRMLEARFNALMTKFQDQAHPEELTRTKLAAKRADFTKLARRGLVTILADRIDRDPSIVGADSLTDAEYIQWVVLEKMYLEVLLEENQNETLKACWAILGDAPLEDDEDHDDGLSRPEDPDAYRLKALQKLRRDRTLAVVEFLAVRRSAGDELVDRVLEYVSVGCGFRKEAARPWKAAQYILMIALDRPEELERNLRSWIRNDEFPAPWQRTLAQLQAERGLISEAISLLETAGRSTQLTIADYAVLGDWYLLADQQDRYRRAKIEVFMAKPEYRINNWLTGKRQPWNVSDVSLPSELDEEVLYAFQALFEKSNQPENYLQQLVEFYRACGDFRLLQVLPDALLGRTSQQIYPFLMRLQDKVLNEVRDEAVVGKILDRIAVLRSTSESDLDLRALGLLEAIVERKAAELLDQPTPHVKAAIAALQLAFEREWADGEVRQMANLLESMGKIGQQSLNAERLRELRELKQSATPGTDDHLYISWYLARAVYYSHQQPQDALNSMEQAVLRYQQTHSAGWPVEANGPLSGYVEMLEEIGRFAAAEDLVTRHERTAINKTQSWWMKRRRNELYLNAFADDGQVSLGQGIELYRNLAKHLRAQFSEAGDDVHRQKVVQQVMRVYQIAKDKSIRNFEDDVRHFIDRDLPRILKKQTNDYQILVSNTATNVHELLGPRDALAFVLSCYEAYPSRFKYTYQHAWQQFAFKMSIWHRKLKNNIGDLEPRLLAIVNEELRRDLTTQERHGAYFYHSSYSHYWSEKIADFATVAEEVLEQHLDSGRTVTYIGEYLFYGLNRRPRAIEIMFAANDRGVLDLTQRVTLADMLRDSTRYGEAVPILRPIVGEVPGRMDYRTRLLTCFQKSGRNDQTRELLSDTDEYFRQKGRWTESNIAQLASTCFEIRFFLESVQYYDELIPLHQRTAANRGIGGYSLSGYYAYQARAYSGLGETKKAIDAATAAVIAWGPRHDQRSSALYWLSDVINSAKDLDDYVARRDKEVVENGEDSPLIRQYLGIAYAARDEHAKAIEQLRASLELQSTNVKAHEQLIICYDKIGDEPGAIRQTLALLDIDRHNLDLYVTLAKRLSDDEALGERAATTLVEAAPREAAHHQKLAEFRQSQDRWEEAIEHWRHVAKLRALEPEGLLRLAEAQIHREKFDEARATIDRVNRTDWPSRFGEVTSRVRQMRQKMPR